MTAPIHLWHCSHFLEMYILDGTSDNMHELDLHEQGNNQVQLHVHTSRISHDDLGGDRNRSDTDTLAWGAP